MRFSLRTFHLGAVLFSGAVVGCGDGATSAAAVSGAGGAGAGTVGSGANTTAGSGAATSGAAGAGGCLPLAQTACYTGPPGTEEVGACRSGVMTCLADGSAFGPCEGQLLPAVEDCATVADEDCDGVAEPCPGAAVWAEGYGGDDDQWGTSIFSDNGGQIAVAGVAGGQLDFGGGDLASSGFSDVFLAKLDPNGGHLWSKMFPFNGAQGHPNAGAFDSAGDIYLTGFFDGVANFGGGSLFSQGGGDVFLVKLSGAGNYIWGRSFGDPSAQVPRALAVIPGAGVVITGTFTGTLTFDGGNTSLVSTAGSPDIFMASFDSNGNPVLSSRWGDAAIQNGAGVAVDPAGNILLGATVHGSVQFGSTVLSSAGQSDIAIVKWSPQGGYLWSKMIGNTSSQEVSTIATDTSGNVIVSGTSTGIIDFGGGPQSPPAQSAFYVLKLDPSGGYLWSRLYGNGFTASPVFVATDKDDNVLLTGRFVDTIDLGGGALSTTSSTPDAFVLKLSPDGMYLWSKQCGDSSLPYASQAGYAITADPTRHVLFTGYFAGSVDLGTGEILAGDPSATVDVFVAKLWP